jgi:aspartyl-tRNA(Asn)/glutamyl-tRNA(Gln) amidotransferase subunit B
MRSKEEAHDYRYFPDPDLVPLEISQDWIDELKKTLPKLATEMQKQFVEEYGLTDYAAGVLTADKDAATYFAVVSAKAVNAGMLIVEGAREAANWTTGDLRALLNEKGIGFDKNPIAPERLAELIVMKHKGEISGPIAKTVLMEMFSTGRSADEIVKAKGLTQVSDEGALGKIIDEVIAKSPAQVQQYKSGKEQILGFLVGQVMKASGGKANPGKVNELLRKKLQSKS